MHIYDTFIGGTYKHIYIYIYIYACLYEDIDTRGEYIYIYIYIYIQGLCQSKYGLLHSCTTSSSPVASFRIMRERQIQHRYELKQTETNKYVVITRVLYINYIALAIVPSRAE